MPLNSKLESLRTQIRSLEGHHLETKDAFRILPFADPRLNAPLPQAGLPLGALHEFCASGFEGELAAAVTGFAAAFTASLLERSDGFLLWVSNQGDCYPPGLSRLGLPPARIIWVECSREAEVFGVMEEALQSRAIAAVLGEAANPSLKAGRRLDAAARLAGRPALLLRRHHSKTKAAEEPSGAAATRWRVGAFAHDFAGRYSGNAQAAMSKEEPGVGPPRWRLDLEYCRNGRTASWIVEASDGSVGGNGKAGHVRVVAELRHDARAPEAAAPRKTA